MLDVDAERTLRAQRDADGLGQDVDAGEHRRAAWALISGCDTDTSKPSTSSARDGSRGSIQRSVPSLLNLISLCAKRFAIDGPATAFDELAVRAAVLLAAFMAGCESDPAGAELTALLTASEQKMLLT